MRQSSLPLLLAISLGAACGESPEAAANSGWLEARWTGADSGRMSAPATAEWCAEERLLEIRAIKGDTGLALVLYPADTIEADTYRVVQPDGADSLPPSAGLALRVFSSSAIQGYQGDSGAIVLERSKSGELSGTMEATARSVANGQQLTLTGKVRDLTMVPQGRGCGPETPADSGDTNAELSSTDVD